MIQTSTTTTTRSTTTARFLLRILTLWSLILLAVTAADDATPPSFHRQTLRLKCGRTCPLRTPRPTSSCCYTGTDECNYDYVYAWDISCENIRCIPVMTCGCGPDPRNQNGRVWTCSTQQRRELAAFECPVTEETPLETANLASSVGMSCTPDL